MGDQHIDIVESSDEELTKLLAKHGVSLTLEEARHIPKLLGRNPTLTELYVFNIEWSEHCSYKSSKPWLKKLPTNASNVIIGPGEDAGVIALGAHEGVEYALVVGHESHNHPSQVVPFEGAATGVGGIIRDVVCMGAKVIGTLDGLRFGDPFGPNKQKVRYIATEVVEGVAGYGNPLGIPNLGGDVYFSSGFDENCLVNVAALGVVATKNIIHSRVPKDSVGYDVILVGKATDNSGFGGAAFASVILDDKDKESNRGAVQVPDPFLKNVIIRATNAVFEEVAKNNVDVGFKDLGAGGVMCATSELGYSGGFGMQIDLNKVPVAIPNLPPYIIACAETQERFCWVVPPAFTQRVLDIYNKEFEMGYMSFNAGAAVIGKVIQQTQFIMTYNSVKVCDAPISAVCEPIFAQRVAARANPKQHNDSLPQVNWDEYVQKLVSHLQVCSKARIYRHYDTVVLGNTQLSGGQADAAIIRPIAGSKIGVAVKMDGNPFVCKVDAREGTRRAVAETVRNIVAVGTTPRALTDCLNFGNPTKPEHYRDFTESIEGLGEAARVITQLKNNEAIPYVSGNVSLYNESASGQRIDPSPIVMGVGITENADVYCTPWLKKEHTALLLIGKPLPGLGGSVFSQISNIKHDLTPINCEDVKKECLSVLKLIEQGEIFSCHDISDGGLLAALCEMSFLNLNRVLGLHLNLHENDLVTFLCSESGGFVIEVDQDKQDSIIKLLVSQNVAVKKIGLSTNDKYITMTNNGNHVFTQDLLQLKSTWESALSGVWA